MKQGYIYVLIHPSESDLYKVGITTRTPEQRLAEHNRNYDEYTGQIVKETGQEWVLKEAHAVPDPYWAEAVFWGETGLADIPYRNGIEVERLKWEVVQKSLEVAKKAGIRPKKKLADYVYAYTAEMKNRLRGRDIYLIGFVTSRSGKATFKCINGHEWRARSTHVAEGEGCPQCGKSELESQDIWKNAGLGYICLLTHPRKPEVVRIGMTYHTLEQCYENNVWGEWEVHRYRFVPDPALAQSLMCDLLEIPVSNVRDPINIDLTIAEQALRDLLPRMQSEIALNEMRNEEVQKN